jgi:hypothetical protein
MSAPPSLLETSAAPSVRWAPLVAGAVLLLATWGLEQTRPGLDFAYNGGFTDSSRGALQFWLAHALLVVPGCLMVVWGLGGPLVAPLWRLWRALGDPRSLWFGMACVAVLATLASRLGHGAVLLDFPITDDEHGARFGGQVLALGRSSVPWPVPRELLEPQFLFPTRDGGMNSCEWPALLLSWAVAEATGLGPWVFSMLSGATAALVGVLAGRRLGPAWGWVAAALFVASPMASALSWSTHGHVVSRFWIALALWGAWEWHQGGGKAKAAWVGLGFGFAVIARAPEGTLLLGPVLVGVGLLKVRARAWGELGALALGGVPPLLLLLGYDWLWTGELWEVPRLSARGFGDFAKDEPWLWRFGSNFSFNLLMLLVWGLGCLGGPLVALGASRAWWCKLEFAGVALLLGLAMFHVIVGIHVVGPIHYSDCAVAWVLLATEGLRRLHGWGQVHPEARRLLVAVVGALLLGNALFVGHNARQMHRQAQVHATIFGFVEQEMEARKIDRAVIFSPLYIEVWRAVPPLAQVGTFVYDWPFFHPDGSSKVVYLRTPKDAAALEQALRAFPGHTPLVLSTGPDAPWLLLRGLEEVQGR